jgi:hypothetical protein
VLVQVLPVREEAVEERRHLRDGELPHQQHVRARDHAQRTGCVDVEEVVVYVSDGGAVGVLGDGEVVDEDRRLQQTDRCRDICQTLIPHGNNG